MKVIPSQVHLESLTIKKKIVWGMFNLEAPRLTLQMHLQTVQLMPKCMFFMFSLNTNSLYL